MQDSQANVVTLKRDMQAQALLVAKAYDERVYAQLVRELEYDKLVRNARNERIASLCCSAFVALTSVALVIAFVVSSVVSVL